jgi:hypothetical protein
MAACSKCGTQVGCGCQLRQGLCGACYSLVHKIKTFCLNVIS